MDMIVSVHELIVSVHELIQSYPHEILNIKGKDEQIQLNSHKKNWAQLFKANDVIS